MNLKKYMFAVLAVLMGVGAFAYPAPQDDDPVTTLLQQYQAQVQEMQKGFEKQLLSPVKAMAALALEIQNSGQTDLTPEQAALFEKHTTALDKGLNELVAPAMKDFDLAKFNEQYAQMAKTYGLPAQQLTLQEVTDMFKGMYLISALGYFEQAKKLTNDEMEVLVEIFFPQEEEDAN